MLHSDPLKLQIPSCSKEEKQQHDFIPPQTCQWNNQFSPLDDLPCFQVKTDLSKTSLQRELNAVFVHCDNFKNLFSLSLLSLFDVFLSDKGISARTDVKQHTMKG